MSKIFAYLDSASLSVWELTIILLKTRISFLASDLWTKGLSMVEKMQLGKRPSDARDRSSKGLSMVEKMQLRKRPFDGSDIDQPHRKRPALTSVTLGHLEIDDIQDLEPFLRRVIGEEVDHALTKFGPPQSSLSDDDSPKKLLCSELNAASPSHHPVERTLQLQFESLFPKVIYAGTILEEQGGNIAVILVDLVTGKVVDSGPVSRLKLDMVVVSGGFNEDENWGEERFTSGLMKPREGRPPLLHGTTTVKLENGVAHVGNLKFTDNSRWTSTGKVKLVAMVSPGRSNGGDCIGKAFSNAFAVRDQRGELGRKHYPPKPNDDVWRLKHIGKKGVFHNQLVDAGINTVGDFVRLERMNPQRLRLILGPRVSEKKWSSLTAHARTCELSEERCPEKDTSFVFNKNPSLNGTMLKLQCPNSAHTMFSNNHVPPPTATCQNGVVLDYNIWGTGQDWQNQNIEVQTANEGYEALEGLDAQTQNIEVQTANGNDALEGLGWQNKNIESLDNNIFSTSQNWQNQNIEVLDYNFRGPEQYWQNQNIEALDCNVLGLEQYWQNQNIEALDFNTCGTFGAQDWQNQNIEAQSANDGYKAFEGHNGKNQNIKVQTTNYGNKALEGSHLQMIIPNKDRMEYPETHFPCHVNSSPMKWSKILVVMKFSMIMRKGVARQRA